MEGEHLAARALARGPWHDLMLPLVSFEEKQHTRVPFRVPRDRIPPVVYLVPDRAPPFEGDPAAYWPEDMPEYIPKRLVRRVVAELTWAARMPGMSTPLYPPPAPEAEGQEAAEGVEVEGIEEQPTETTEAVEPPAPEAPVEPEPAPAPTEPAPDAPDVPTDPLPPLPADASPDAPDSPVEAPVGDPPPDDAVSLPAPTTDPGYSVPAYPLPSLLPTPYRIEKTMEGIDKLVALPPEERTPAAIGKLVYLCLVPEMAGEAPEESGATITGIEAGESPQTARQTEDAATLAKLLPDLRHLGTAAMPNNVPTARLRQLAARIENDPRLTRLLELVGRLSASGWMAQREPSLAREDVLGTTLGNDLSRLTASEAIRFGVPELDWLAYLDLVENRLMLLETVGSEPKARGPILVALDVSPSMDEPAWGTWSRKEVAQALGLGLVRIASIQKRSVCLVAFAEEVTYAAEATRFEQYLALQEALLGGLPEADGTDFSPPLAVLAHREMQKGFRGGDLVMLTDGDGPVSDRVADAVNLCRRKGLRVFTLTIGEDADPEDLRRVSDQIVRLGSDADLTEVADAISTDQGARDDTA